MQKPFLGRRYALLSLALCSVVLSGCTTGSGSSGGGGGGGGGTPPEAPFNLGEISGVARLRGTTVNTAVGLFTGTGLLADIKTLSNNSGRAADLPGKIAYQHEATGASDLYLLTNEGRDLADLTVTSTSINKKPALSPNALKIAFTTTRDGNEEIYVNTFAKNWWFATRIRAFGVPLK